ncbi:hypothetical protein MIR68_003917 [Amoeboaphelidium protococcarum]|nr:hypothetical protein MIR68_003917 [Amoeboaphelidium protococcarum]
MQKMMYSVLLALSIANLVHAATLRILDHQKLEIPIKLFYQSTEAASGVADVSIELDKDESTRRAMKYVIAGPMKAAISPIGKLAKFFGCPNLIPHQNMRAAVVQPALYQLKANGMPKEKDDDSHYTANEHSGHQEFWKSNYKRPYSSSRYLYFVFDFRNERKKSLILETFQVRMSNQWGKHDIEYSVGYSDAIPKDLDRQMVFTKNSIQSNGRPLDLLPSDSIAHSVIVLRVEFLKCENLHTMKPQKRNILHATFDLVNVVDNPMFQPITLQPQWQVFNDRELVHLSNMLMRQSNALKIICHRQPACSINGKVRVSNEINLASLQDLDRIVQLDISVEELVYEWDEMRIFLFFKTIEDVQLDELLPKHVTRLIVNVVKQSSDSSWVCARLLSAIPPQETFKRLRQALQELI